MSVSQLSRVLIVDDEEPARRKIGRFLAEDPRFVLAGEAASGQEAVEKIVELEPDLVFLDVQMPGFNGFDVLASLPRERLPHVIFTTAFAEFALQAFEVRAVDYLLKPFDQRRFRAACETYCERRVAAAELWRAIESLRPASQHLERLLVRGKDRMIPVNLRDVSHISAEEKYVRVHLAEGSLLHRMPLSELASRLDPDRFARVHRSEIVNLDQIAGIEPWDHGDAILTLRDGSQILASRSYRSNWKSRFG